MKEREREIERQSHGEKRIQRQRGTEGNRERESERD